jgi:hypothetical protein
MVQKAGVAVMISHELVFYCLVSAAAYLLVVSAALNWSEKKAGLMRGVPKELVEETGLAWFVINYIMELLFYVVIPTIAYGFFYMVIPLSGIRAGMAATLVSFALGAVPILMSLSVRIKLPMSYLLFVLLSFLIKLGGSLILIGYIYAL